MTRQEIIAAAIANARGNRRGAPAVTNILDMIKPISGGKLYDEVMDDARAVIAADTHHADLVAALTAMVDRWEPDCTGTDRVMWENARSALAKAGQPI